MPAQLEEAAAVSLPRNKNVSYEFHALRVPVLQQRDAEVRWLVEERSRLSMALRTIRDLTTLITSADDPCPPPTGLAREREGHDNSSQMDVSTTSSGTKAGSSMQRKEAALGAAQPTASLFNLHSSPMMSELLNPFSGRG
jgi:hypothetical protein